MTDEWIKKLWYICSREYDSAINRNAFEPVLMRWMTWVLLYRVKEVRKRKTNMSVEMQTWRPDLRTRAGGGKKERVGQMEGIAWKHIH